jgi:hypothetical protein
MDPRECYHIAGTGAKGLSRYQHLLPCPRLWTRGSTVDIDDGFAVSWSQLHLWIWSLTGHQWHMKPNQTRPKCKPLQLSLSHVHHSLMIDVVSTSSRIHIYKFNAAPAVEPDGTTGDLYHGVGCWWQFVQ